MSFRVKTFQINMSGAPLPSVPVEDPQRETRRDLELLPAVHEEGWMPKPAILHAGKARSCAVCFAPLQYSAIASWDEYLKSDEFLAHLQGNLLNDTFVRGLICGENYFGDLPTEHRMHPQRRMKCRQNVEDHLSMNSAGLLDSSDKDKSLVRTLEELLIDGLSTPTFTYVLERRFAVIFHSAKIVSAMMKSVRVQRLPRILSDAAPHVELHHVAIRALSTLLTFFDIDQENALEPFQEMARMLTNFPPLSLFSYWSPEQRAPEQEVAIEQHLIDATHAAPLHAPSLVVDGSESTYWLTPARPGMVFFSISAKDSSTTSLPPLTSLGLVWFGTSQPTTLVIQAKTRTSGNEFVVVKEFTSRPGLPLPDRMMFPAIAHWQQVRLVMSGVPATNKDATYGLVHVRLFSPIEATFSPQQVMHDVESWLVRGATLATNDSLAMEGIGALKAWALATGSLAALLRFVELLLSITNPSTKIERTLVHEGAALVAALEAHELTERERVLVARPAAESRKVRAGFEATLCSAGTTVEDGGQTVRTRETSYQHAIVNAPIASGKASWKFRLDTDTVDDEMTCFGAAIVPVTVSGYDSSPSLWMLRGYNGNLYARGHKLSRSIGKVHPGDIVQIDVDMTAGTMAYTINSTEYGVVFTDLSGHEVYPAVSFYGSGKVITLLSLHKWGAISSQSLSTPNDPIYLSTLPEYEHSVGHGRLGRGNLLGYSGESSSSAATEGNNQATAASTSTISVNGEAKQRSISTHPPARGEAYVSFDLGKAYANLTGQVALNDDVSNETLAQRGISVVFSIVGDAAVLWKSKPVTTTTQLEAFDVSLAGVRMIELRVSCSGSNHGAHAIWVDPYATLIDDWSCPSCLFVNKGVAASCAVCAAVHPPSPSSPTSPEAPGATKTPRHEDEDDDLKLLTTLEDLNQARDALDEVATAIVAAGHRLATILLESPPYQVQFEEAFSFQPHPLTLECLTAMIEMHLVIVQQFPPSSRRHALALYRCQLLIECLGRQLRLLGVFETSSAMDAIDASAVAHIRTLLESLAHVHVSNPMSPAKSKAWMPKVALPLLTLQTTAAQTLIHGLGLLYPASSDRTSLLLTLLRSYSQDRFSPSSARHVILSRLLSLLALPGEMGVLTFFPVVPDRLHSSQVQEIMKHLLTCPPSSPELEKDALACIQTFQFFLLSQAIESTQAPNDAHRVVVQDMTMRYSELLLSTARKSMEESLDSGGDEAEAAADLSPFLHALLPPFVSGLCLLRRQTWLIRPLFPKITMVLRILDVVCGQSEVVRKSERRLLALDRRLASYAMEVDDVGKWQVDKSPRRVQKQLYNVFSKLYTGEKDHFEGQIGFQFEAMASFTLVALGRSVNPSRNGGKLLHKHTIRLWDEASQALLGTVTVGPLSPCDAMGYVFEYLTTPLRLSHGKLYRLTTQEFANGGDPWYKKENLPDEEYDTSFIKILRDCYASGSTGFPNSQNLTGAAYGVPTFLVEEDNPMDTPPAIAPMDGLQTLKFNGKRKAASIAIGHLGNTLTVMGETGLWRTIWCASAITTGVHVMEFIVKSSRVGGGVSGHVCIGFECNLSGLQTANDFLGHTAHSVGYMPAIGCVWNQGLRVPLDGADKIVVHAGDILAMCIDYDRHRVVFSHNGRVVGALAMHLPLACVPAVSVYGMYDVVDIRPGGLAKSTLQLHWLLDVLNTTASLAGRFAGTIISGPPIDGVEEELQPWLQSKLLSGGPTEPPLPMAAHTALPTWSAALRKEGSFQNARYNITNEKSAPFVQKRKSAALNPLLDAEFCHALPTVAPRLVQWLETKLPDTWMWRRQETYPQVETTMCAALIKHAPPHVLHEAKAVIESQEMTLEPSHDMAQVWKYILMLRHWLIRSKHEYRSKEDAAADGGGDEAAAAKLTGWEQKLTLPQSFQAFLDQVHMRAAFLCNLEPPIEETNRSSHLALSNLADKWSAETPPLPSLQPMVERWKSLSESDRSKWNGLVQVLQAQHKWRTRGKSDAANDDQDVQDDDHRYLSAMLRACDLYVRNGVGAPPDILNALLERRYARSESRIYGLEAMKCILNCMSFDTARYSALLFLRPALRGFTEEERLSRETYQEPLEGSFRPTVRHHYLKGLEGCNRPVLDQVQDAFIDLYAFLAQLAAKTSSSKSSLVLQQSLLAAWSLDFEPRDHEFLLQVDILGLLSKHFSVATLSQRARDDMRQAAHSVVTEWHPLAEDYVRQGLLVKGTLTKRAVLRVMQQAPPYAPSIAKRSIGRSFQSVVSKHTASSMVLAYSDFLRRLHGKLKWCKPFDLGRKVVQVNLGEDVSLVEFPALPPPPSNTSSFCIELWFYAVELQGYSTLRSDVGFADGSVHVELVENRLQVAIAGNVPREMLFQHTFASFAWHHVAIIYDHDKPALDLVVNGAWKETLSYAKTCPKIHWRTARVGSWIAELSSTNVQRKFRGILAELRVWHHVRSVDEIEANFQRRDPADMDKDKDVVLYSWHLEDGEGELAVCAESTNFNALLTKCHWTRMNVPLWAVQVPTPTWQRAKAAVVAFQRRFRQWRHKAWMQTMHAVKETLEQEELTEEGWILSDEEDNCYVMAPTVEAVVGRLQLQRTAWILFKLLGIVAISGIRERVEVEAVQAALSAKKRRLDKSSSGALKSVDDASDVAKSAATSTALEVPVAQRLWFSIELHRKVFDTIERELAAATKLIHDAEKLIRAQQPAVLRSMSTPVQQMTQEAAPLEPLEIEAYVFHLLLFLISQSDAYPAQDHLSKPAVLRELLLLLRMGSPRAQRLVQLLLRRIASVVTPAQIGALLGSDAVFIDLLLDRVSDSIGSEAEPISQSSMRESLANPLGFNTGQIFLALAAESVALLRLLLREPAWRDRVSDVLSAAIRKAAPVVHQAETPNLRTRVVVLRAMGALCVLGAHLDCLRLGGKVEVASSNEAPSVATLVSRHDDTARVVFDDGSKVQPVPLGAVSPVEEIPSLLDANVAELMPTLLHFATLQDDTLWRAQLRSRALLALESFLQHDHLLISTSLVQTALTPLHLPAFVTTAALQERSRSILSRLIEASTPLGRMMFRGLPDPAPLLTDDVVSASTMAAAAPPPLPPSPPVSTVRQGFAATLASMGFEMDLCLVALEHSRDDPNAAVEWLTGDQAAIYRRNHMASSTASAAFRVLNDTTREEKARDLAAISGMPRRLVLSALEICGNDANRAVEWLLEHGRRFSTPLNVQGDAFCQDMVERHDAAALEVADQSDTLLLDPATAIPDATTVAAAAAASSNDVHAAAADSSLMPATLAPIVPRDPKNGWGALPDGYLVPNVVLTVSDAVGPVAQLGRSGTVVGFDKERGVLLSFLNTENGALEEEYVDPTKVKRWSRVFDQALVAVDSIYDVALRTEQALSTCYARRAIVALLGSDSSTVLELVGGTEPFVQLIKLVVGASFATGSSGATKSGASPSHGRKALQSNLMHILKDNAALSTLLVHDCISHFVESTHIARDGSGGDKKTPLEFESLHPYYHKSDYIANVSVPPQTPLPVRLVFDKRSCLLSKTTLSFYADVDCKHALASFGAAKPFHDVWIAARSFWYKLHAAEECEVTTYGFRFQVVVLPSIAWTNELDVLQQPSLDYACWLLEFLLSAPPLLEAHYMQIYASLVSYLQSPRAPQKHKVVQLLLQLLVRYPTAALQIEPLQRIGELAVAKAQADIAKGTPFVSSHVLQLVEVAVVVSFPETTAPFVAPIAPPIVVPTEAASMLPIIAETVQLARMLLDSTHGILPQELVALIWLDMFGASATLESSDACQGTLDFLGAHSLRICLDPRFPRDDLVLEVGMKADDNPAAAAAVVFMPLVLSDVMDVVGNCLRYTFTPQSDTAHLSLSVVALGMSLERQLARCTIQGLEACAAKLGDGAWTPLMDAQLVDWVNVHLENQGESLHTELLPSDIRFHPTLDGLRCSLLLHLPWSTIQLRYALLRCFNTRLSCCISLLNLKDAEQPWTIAHLLRQVSHCIFVELKLKVVDAAIDATVVPAETTNANNNTARITLDRLRALESREDREVEPSASECFFAQAFRQLHVVDPKLFRRKIDSKGRLFSVKFRGEEGVDWGGVYREGTNSMVDDLFAPHFNLFLLCPNGQHNTGLNRGMYLPNSKCTSPVTIQMFEFVGKLVGISLRTKGDFPFAFCPLVWKILLKQPLEKADLEGTDALLVQMLNGIRDCDLDGITTEEQFHAAFADLDLRFTTFDSNGQLVELVAGGHAKAVTFANRVEYCDLVEMYRLHEFDVQCAAMVRGLSTLFPTRVLTVLNWQEMEMLSCGSPKIDIALWKQHTRYDGYTEQDETVRLFWEVMSSFSDEQRSDFVRFAWGRSRLPRGKWPQPFKLTKKAGRDSVLSLPVAHTCFFSVELPPYTTKQKMHDMLLATINFGLGGILIA
ncbi:unnamed protein product [Aphanomyces euteiches]|nr:hypothetical protein AeRB84_018826 [Aphanomyces euteiches]